MNKIIFSAVIAILIILLLYCINVSERFADIPVLFFFRVAFALAIGFFVYALFCLVGLLAGTKRLPASVGFSLSAVVLLAHLCFAFFNPALKGVWL